jgi:hypothetical protein
MKHCLRYTAAMKHWLRNTAAMKHWLRWFHSCGIP